MRLSDIHIQGILGFAGSIFAALIGFCSGKSWEAQMAEKIYNDKSVFGNFSFYSYKKACGQKKTVRGSKNSRRLSNGTPAI